MPRPGPHAAFTFGPISLVPIITTAIHVGHDLRPGIASRVALDDDTRRREEDPYTDRIADARCTRVVVHRSRFEVDLNRPRDEAVYGTPDTAWGLDVWTRALPDAEVERSLAIHDDFYLRMAEHLDEFARRGPFVVLDVHSYNHRRGGPDAPPEPWADHPEVNVGTGSLDHQRWGDLVGTFIDDLRSEDVRSHPLDVRENITFEGGYFSSWVDERYDGTGCALAIEFKKVFMDEWTGTPDDAHIRELNDALAATFPAMLDGLR